MTSKYLITPALPYASGPIHLGHLLEHIQTNIFVRALRLSGAKVLNPCGLDSHGTAVELGAAKAGLTPEEFIEQCQKSHIHSLKLFDIEFDGGYGSTHTKENKHHAQSFFTAIKNHGDIYTKDIDQLYDPQKKRFLPDRMVKGECPKCHADDQYGDNCENCGATYRPTELISPKSVISGATPILKTSKHYFITLKPYHEKLQSWIKNCKVLNKQTENFLDSWFKEGLKDWDISRDKPYFGFKIPGEQEKYFYVWLDAPIGYISLSEIALRGQDETIDDYWKSKDCEIIHFIGKDVVYFHTLFWPAMLMANNYNLPKKIMVHGMLTVDGKKMSKSRGTFIAADVFAKYINPEALRYYFACKLSTHTEDIDLNFEDFTSRVHADLVNNIINLVSRTVPLLHKNHRGEIGSLDNNANGLIAEVKQKASSIEKLYKNCEFAQAMKTITSIASLANGYLQQSTPWVSVKSDGQLAQNQLTTALWIGKACIAYLKPVLPKVAFGLEKILTVKLDFNNALDVLKSGAKINKYTRLFERIDKKVINKMIEESKQINENNNATKKTASDENKNNEININDFIKIDLRAAKVIQAKNVDGADKLLHLQLDAGSLGQKSVFTGLRPHVEADDLVGKMVTLVANLKPRKMRFGISEGMILAAGDKKPSPIFCDGAAPGDKIS